MQTETIDYKLKFNKLGQLRKFSLAKKARLKIIDNSSWIEAETKNQWYYKDYRSFYIVISMYKDKEYTITCSGYRMKRKYYNLKKAQIASFKFCDKILK
jgi:hypothetical protein